MYDIIILFLFGNARLFLKSLAEVDVLFFFLEIVQKVLRTFSIGIKIKIFVPCLTASTKYGHRLLFLFSFFNNLCNQIIF